MNKTFLILLLLFIGSNVYSQDEAAVEERVVSKTISIDELRKVQYLEDLLDSFPKDEYYINYCQITRSGKGYVTTSIKFDNNKSISNSKNTSPSKYRAPIITTLFDIPDRPVKPGQKYLFDRIQVRKFKDKNNSEFYPSLELYVTN